MNLAKSWSHAVLFVTLVIRKSLQASACCTERWKRNATADLESGYSLEFPDAKKLVFEGMSKLDKNKTYKLDLDLYAEVETDADKRKESLNGKELSLVLTKKGAMYDASSD